MLLRAFAVAAVWLAAGVGRAETAPDGRAVYERACAHCHGAEGEGWREKNGPTLRKTEWVTGDPDRLIRITLDGLYLRIPLGNGTHYGCMPGLRHEVTDQEVAAVLSYVRTAWGNAAGVVSAERVAVLRAATPAREQPWTAADFGLEAKAKLGVRGEALEPADPFAAAGFKVYGTLCQSCHQPDGRGLITEDGHGFPPLRDSVFVNGSSRRLIRIVLGGLQGEVVVKGRVFKEVMPPWHGALNDEQVAQVLTFVRQAWGHSAPPIRPEQVRDLRAECVSRGGLPWTMEEIDLREAADGTGQK